MRSGYTVMMLPAVIVPSVVSPHPQIHPIDEDSPLYPPLAVLSDISVPSDDLSSIHSPRLSRCFTSSHLDINRVGAGGASDA